MGADSTTKYFAKNDFDKKREKNKSNWCLWTISTGDFEIYDEDKEIIIYKPTKS